MKLKHIRLTGFKSFADNETLVFPGAMTGIVGPNGCGKSNVVDAIRWVMGETSHHIRATTLDDVVFNGTASRKPTEMASVEILFDNSDGGLGGQYATYAEISVRRTVNRGRESKYYLNGSVCRRKDIKSVMQGTGLAGNSYAIIGQGMVSHLVDARPEEVRGYIEEAAGITGYKNRRRESEARMKRTRENLERVADIRDEVAKQLAKLKRQSRDAERYTALKRDKKRLTLEIGLLEQGLLKKEIDTLNTQHLSAKAAYEKKQAGLSGVDARLEEARAYMTESGARLDVAKEKLYEHSAILTGAEREAQSRDDSKRKLENDLAEVRTGLEKAEADLAERRERKETLIASKAALNKQVEELGSEVEKLKQSIDRCGTRNKEVGDLLQARYRETRALTETLEVEKAKVVMYEDELKRGEETEGELLQQQTAATTAGDEQSVQAKKEDLEKSRIALDAAVSELKEMDKTVAALDDNIHRVTDRLHKQQAEERQLQGRLESLNALQEEALRKKDTAVDTWLSANGLSLEKQLANQIKVDPRWETAVGAVLASFFPAITVDTLDRHAGAYAQFDGGMLGLIEFGESIDGAESAAKSKGEGRRDNKPEEGKYPGTLSEKVSGCEVLSDILGRVKTAKSLDEALARRKELRAGESLVTSDGVWMGRHWLRLYKMKRENEGILSRRHRIEDLRRDLNERKKTNREATAELDGMRRRRVEAEEHRGRLRDELSELRTRVATREATLGHREELLRHRHEEAQKMTRRLTEVRERLAEVRAAREVSGQAIAEAEERMGVIDSRYGDLDADRTGNDEAVKKLEETLEQAQAQLRNAEIGGETARMGIESADEHIAGLRRQIEDFRRRQTNMTASLAEIDDPDDKQRQELERLLQDKLALEGARAEAEKEVKQIDEKIKTLGLRRNEASAAVEQARTLISEHRVALQVAKSRHEGRQKELDALLNELGDTDMSIDETATIESKREELDAVRKKSDKLGAINLAAMDEFSELGERKKYLDTQYDDLTSALQSLTKAIKEIDEESERRFTTTLEKINTNLARVFPRLFNGGRAYLKVIGDDNLNDGVAVMVKPPGKRLAHIGLLSGGEKALAAAAVLFSIFSLNPAPFCVLDEVDAPLDDHNVEQLCVLLREMSEQVQFIMVTHNKISMEYADHLIGITMREPGVTRLVSVDMDSVVSHEETETV